MRQVIKPVGFTLAVAAVGLAIAGTSWAATAGSSAADTATRNIPITVSGSAIHRRLGTARVGTAVRDSQLGRRVFVNAHDGYALANLPQAQYPARTADGGRTWHTYGPALHVNAAQAPLVVTEFGAAGRHSQFAFGGGGQVVDATNDGGRHWYSAVLGDVVISVVAPGPGRLIALAQDSPSVGSAAINLVYVSRNGGRTWRLNTRLGAS